MSRLNQLSRAQLALMFMDEHMQWHKKSIRWEKFGLFCFFVLAVAEVLSGSRSWFFLSVYIFAMVWCAVDWHRKQMRAIHCYLAMQDQIQEIVYEDYGAGCGVDWKTGTLMGPNAPLL